MIVHGTKRVERRIGYVADFCPVCRSPRIFRLLRIGIASHIYFVSFGDGKLVGHLMECLTCGVSTVTDPLRYKSTETKPGSDVEMMIQKTLPELRAIYADRLELEEGIRRDPRSLTEQQRAEFLAEPFRLLNPMVELRFENSSQMDKQAGIGCLATLIVPVLVIWGAHLIGKADADVTWFVALGAGGLLVLYTFVQLHFAPTRFVRGKIIPVIAKGLRPLEPTKEELSDCLARCKTAGMKVGRYAKLDALIAELVHTPLRSS